MKSTDNSFNEQINTEAFNYDQWRSRFLNTVLRVVSILGFFLIVTIVPSISIFEIFILGVLYLSLLLITFVPLPYTMKAGGLLGVGFFVGVFNLIRLGAWSDSTIFFLATTIFASLLFENRMDRWTILVNTVSISIVGFLDISGIFHITYPGLPSRDPFEWLLYAGNYVALAIAAAQALNLLKNEFNQISEQYRSALFLVTKDRSELEQRVEERTSGLIKKTDQLRAVSYIAHRTAEIQDLETLLRTVVNLITEQFGHYHTAIFLMNETGDEVVLQSASSDGGRQMMSKGYSVKANPQEIVGYAASQKKARIAIDVGADAAFFNNPDLPLTRSEIAIPLLIRNKVLGVLDIQSDQPQAFTVEDIDILQTLSDQIAVAIENARLLDDAQTALMQIEALTATRTREAWNQKLQRGNFTYTYTPMGLQVGKEAEDPERSLKIPITLRGQHIGSISLTRKDDTPWTTIDMDLVREVAHQTGLAVDNIRLVEDATQRAKLEQTVGELATRFSQSTDIDGLLQTAARELGQVADVAEVSVYIGQIPEQAPQKRRSKRITG